MFDGGRSRRKSGVTRRARALRQGGNIAEARLWDELKDRKLGNHKFVRQHPIHPYYADFACRKARLVVEVDGSQHADSELDRVRDSFMSRHGWSVLRFWNVDVIKELTPVCETILAALDGRLSEPVDAYDLRFVPGREIPATTEREACPLTASLRSAPLPHSVRGEEMLIAAAPAGRFEVTTPGYRNENHRR